MFKLGDRIRVISKETGLVGMLGTVHRVNTEENGDYEAVHGFLLDNGLARNWYASRVEKVDARELVQERLF